MSGRPSRKSAEISLFRPFSAFKIFALFRRVRRATGKPRKRRKKAFFLSYPQICLNPHLLNPCLRHSKFSPPPPDSPICRRDPPDPLAPLPQDPPPLSGIFNTKNRPPPPPSGASDFHFPSPGQKKEKIFETSTKKTSMTVGILYGAGAETLIFVTGTSGKYPKLFVSRQKNQSRLWIPRKPRKIGVWVSGAEIQTSAVDTRTAVWVSTPERFSKIVLGKTRNSSRKFRGVSAPALCQNPAVIQPISVSNCKKGFLEKGYILRKIWFSRALARNRPLLHHIRFQNLAPLNPSKGPLQCGRLWENCQQNTEIVRNCVAAPKPQKLAEMKFQNLSHTTWSDKLGGILGEDLWVVLYSK